LSADHLALQRLHEAAEAAKVELSSAHQAAISLPFITADASGPKHLETSLTRARFVGLIEPLLAQSTPACEEALAAAGVRAGGLDAVLLLGGSARLDAVAEHAASVLGGAPTLRLARPEEAVAVGAAAVAQRLQEQEFGMYG
jgi:molecular chaperone DnaK